MNFDMYKMMTSDEVVASGINKLSESEQQEILRWGLRMYGLGQHKVGDIHEIKYDGRVVVLDDEMYRLEEYVSVTEDSV
jgi:hypothetical protein